MYSAILARHRCPVHHKVPSSELLIESGTSATEQHSLATQAFRIRCMTARISPLKMALTFSKKTVFLANHFEK